MTHRSPGRRVDAKHWEPYRLASLDAGSWIGPARGRMPFAALPEEWHASRVTWRCAAERPRSSCWTKYVIPEIGAYPISGITSADVGRRRAGDVGADGARARDGDAASALSMMRLVFDHAIRDRRLSVNVARMVALPRGVTKREPHWLRPEQLGRMVMAVPPLCQLVVLFLGTTGAGSRRWPRCGSRASCRPRTGSG